MEFVRRMQERWGRSPAAALVMAIVWVGMLKILEGAHKTDVLFQDAVQLVTAGLRSEKSPRNDVIVVELTDAAAQRRTMTNAPSNRFPREVLHKVLTEVAKARPRAVVVDIFLDEQVPGVDLFTNLCDLPAKVFLAKDFSAGDIVPQLRLKCISAAPAYYKPDDKGVVRETPIAFGENKEPTLPAAVAAFVSGNPAKETHQRIRFPVAGANSIKRFYAEGLFSHEGPGVFRGLAEAVTTNSVVIIAPYYSFSDDVFRVPAWVGNTNTMRGGDLLALSIRTFLDRHKSNPAHSTVTFFKFSMAAFGFLLGLAGVKNELRLHALPLLLLILTTLLSINGYYVPLAAPAVYYYTLYKIGKEWVKWEHEAAERRPVTQGHMPQMERGRNV